MSRRRTLVATTTFGIGLVGSVSACGSTVAPEPVSAPDDRTPTTTVAQTRPDTVAPESVSAPADRTPTTTVAQTRPDTEALEPIPPSSMAPGGTDCVVWIHGRGGGGAPPVVTDGRTELTPEGNATYDGGFEWHYATEADLDAVNSIIETAIDAADCERAVLAGFSNGAALVGAMYCNGHTFGDRLVGAIVDDPVTDGAVIGCAPPSNVPVTVYWTGALAEPSRPGTSCADIGFTCAGDQMIGIDAYASALGVEISPSPETEHQWYREPPEIDRWLHG